MTAFALLISILISQGVSINFVNDTSKVCAPLNVPACYWTNTKKIYVDHTKPDMEMLTLHEVGHYLMRNEPYAGYEADENEAWELAYKLKEILDAIDSSSVRNLNDG